jgi:Flp pilus assembly protein TadG
MSWFTSNRIWLLLFMEDAAGASAIEFAIVGIPFLFLILGILQVGIYYMAQTSLDAGLIAEANTLRSSFTTTAAQTCPAAGVIKTAIVSKSGGLIQNNSSLWVEIRQLTTLDGAILPMTASTDGTCDYGSTTSVLVLRAQSSVPAFVPGFGSLAVRSSALIRRQGA